MKWSRDEAVAAYVEALRSMCETADEVSADLWASATDLPGWSIQDNIAHVIAVEDQLSGNAVPAHTPDYASLPHVRNDFGRHMEIGVDLRRSDSPDNLRAELRQLVALRKSQIENYPDDPSFEVLGPTGGLRPLAMTLPIRTFDVWTHEQDVRRAAELPERVTGRAAAVALERIVDALPNLLSGDANFAADTTFRFVIEPPGPAPAGVTVAVVTTADGQARLVDDESATADVILTMPFAALAHAATGRGRPTSGELSVIGDASLVAPVLTALVMTP